ncbi:MAG: hypothetical protein F9K27_11275 [Anaerolineae bacterium]|nr:MAG: hypothetical protein F9K27_11275 [Anaerolineae bacterium]
MLEWQRLSMSPFLQPQAGTPLAKAVTTPDVLIWQDELIIYSGAIQETHEHIVRLSLPPDFLHKPGLLPIHAEVVLDIDPHAFDSRHVFDPAAVVVNDQVFLYYSASGAGQDQIGLAVSSDGHSFQKHKPAVLAGRAPEVIWWQGRFYLFYVLPGRGYAIFLAVSEDGKQFQPVSTKPILAAGQGWDSYEVTTPRLFQRQGMFYMLYAAAGDAARQDKPDAFGLARSADLLYWERFPHNPVFRKGAPGAWDDGAIWFGTVFEWQGNLYLIYEGGAVQAVEQTPALTQLGLAGVESSIFDQQITNW